MGDWYNSKEAKDLRRAREGHWAAGRTPLSLGLIRGDAPVSDTTLCSILNRVYRKCGIAHLAIVRDDYAWMQAEAWCQASHVQLAFCSRDALLRMTLDGLINLGAPEWVNRRAHEQGMTVWQPLRPKPLPAGPATIPGKTR